MKKITVFVGSARKKLTYDVAVQFLEKLKSFGEVESEIVVLSHHQLGTCRGCLQCFERGEEFCPLKDDRDVLIEKMMSSDGVVIATPNYSFQVSAITKIFLDRLGFGFHRPRFFGKLFTSIVTQGVYGGGKIVNYLDFVGSGLGFNTVKGCVVTARAPMSEAERLKIDRTLVAQSKRFHNGLLKPAYPPPTLFKLWAFRMSRTMIRQALDDSNRDYKYYQDRGWFQSDYYYPTRLGVLKKTAGSLLDAMATKSSKNRAS
jgi:multimeric flavodoxin WrbA